MHNSAHAIGRGHLVSMSIVFVWPILNHCTIRNRRGVIFCQSSNIIPSCCFVDSFIPRKCRPLMQGPYARVDLLDILLHFKTIYLGRGYHSFAGFSQFNILSDTTLSALFWKKYSLLFVRDRHPNIAWTIYFASLSNVCRHTNLFLRVMSFFLVKLKD